MPPPVGGLTGTEICFVGLDVGGTKIAAGLVALPSGRALRATTIPTAPERGGVAVLADALAVAEALLVNGRTQGHVVAGIGVGIAELVDPHGAITSAQTIDWSDLPVHNAFAQLAPTVIESDVRAAALAEALCGAGQRFHLFAYVTVGTGISCCLVQDGHPYAGAHGNALILSSSPLSFTCLHCGHESQFVLEEFASGPALVARYNHIHPGQVTRAQEVLAAVEHGDTTAHEVVRTAGAALGSSVGFLVNVLDPEAIIVGGGLGLAGGLYWDSFVASTRAHIWADGSRGIPILPAVLGSEAGLIGAAAAVWLAQSGRNDKSEHANAGKR